MKKYSILSSAAVMIGALRVNPIALRKTKIVYKFGLSECNRVNTGLVTERGRERTSQEEQGT